MVFSKPGSVVGLYSCTYSNAALLCGFAVCPPMVNTATSCTASLFSEELEPLLGVLDSLAITGQVIFPAEEAGNMVIHFCGLCCHC